MGLLQKAVETYDTHSKLAGQEQEGHQVLAPIAHKIADADLEIALEMDGSFTSARSLEKERTYLLVKVFDLLGLPVGELPRLTVEQVQAGHVLVRGNGAQWYEAIPRCLEQELRAYIRRRGLLSGPVFVTRNGKAMSRTQVTAEIQSLCRDARVDEAKGNPRCLRKLYLATRTDIERSVRLLAEQAYERVLDAEQLAAGWGEGVNCR